MSAPLSESAAFQEYRNRPTSELLIDLLRAHQTLIFRLCYQVLRNAHDAEDAAQEVLLKIPGELRKFSDPDSFRRWLYRVSLNQSLEAARRDARRRVHEKRAAMKERVSESMDHASRLAFFEALAGLDDASRGLLLGHYFEGQPVGAIAEREACAPSTVSSRLEEARASLRRRLSGAVAAVALPDLEKCFTPSPATPNLVKGAVLAKIAAVAGGAVMTTKSLLGPLALIAMLLLCIGGGIVILLRHRTPALAGTSVGQTRLVEPVTNLPAPVLVAQVPNDPADPADEKSEKVESSPLRARLDRFKKWWIAIETERAAIGQDHDLYLEWRNRKGKERLENVAGMKELVLEDPETFMAFLKDPANEAVIGDLTFPNLLTHIGTDPRVHVYLGRPFPELPPALTRGLLELLQSGTSLQKQATFNLLEDFQDVPQEFRNLYLAMIDDRDPNVQMRAISQVARTIPMTPELFSKLKAMGASADSLSVRLRVVGVMGRTPGQEAEAFLLDRMAMITNQNELHQIAFNLDYRYRAARQGGEPILEDQLVKALAAVIARGEDIRFYRMIHTATYLPGERLKPLLMQIMTMTKDDAWRAKLEKAVELIDKGGADREALMKILEPWG